ncbi:response regulator [Paenibacillus rhizoplanae]
MYRVLIVDDQYFALLGLQQGVDWSALSVSDVCLAENVDQAIAVLEQQPVDLLICDIEMPGRSGLELLAWVKQSAPGTLTIMLTCHADFEYAQRAIYHGAFHYLLKPVDYEELMKNLPRGARRDQQAKRAATVRGPNSEVPETVGASAPPAGGTVLAGYSQPAGGARAGIAHPSGEHLQSGPAARGPLLPCPAGAGAVEGEP